MAVPVGLLFPGKDSQTPSHLHGHQKSPLVEKDFINVRSVRSGNIWQVSFPHLSEDKVKDKVDSWMLGGETWEDTQLSEYPLKGQDHQLGLI